MREKIKIGVFAVSIFYSVTIVILALTSYATSVSEIELYDSEENIMKLEQYEKELYSLPQNSCTNAIYDVIRYYKETSYNGYVNIKTLRNGPISMFANNGIQEKCNITNTEWNHYLELEWSDQAFYVDIIDEIYSQYEISFSDLIFRGYYSLADPTEYYLVKNIELEMISKLIDIAKEEGL